MTGRVAKDGQDVITAHLGRIEASYRREAALKYNAYKDRQIERLTRELATSEASVGTWIDKHTALEERVVVAERLVWKLKEAK